MATAMATATATTTERARYVCQMVFWMVFWVWATFGFLADDVDSLLDKANTLGLTLIEEKHKAQWHCLVLKR